MFNLMRTHNRALIIAVTILTIIAFVILYNQASLESLGQSGYARMYGKDLTIQELQRGYRGFELALALGLPEFASTLDGAGDIGEGADFIFNLLVLRHEANRLGIEPSQEEIKNGIAGLRVFQTDGQFDRAKYLNFIQNVLTPRGFTEIQIEETVRDSLVLDRVQAMLDAAPTVSEAQMLVTFRAFQPATGTAVIFDRGRYADSVEVPEEQMEAFYQLNQFQLVVPEYRAVRYVEFELPEAARDLEGPARNEALQKVADESIRFADLAVETSFQAAARETGKEIRESLDFDLSGNVKLPEGVGESTPELAGPATAVAETAFTLTASSPVSDVIEGDGRYYVIELLRETESREMTLEEARPALREQLLSINVDARLEEEAEAAIGSLKEAVASGTSLAEAATAAGFEVRRFEGISAVADDQPEDLRTFADATSLLREGEMSGFFPGGPGGFAVFLEERAAPTPEELAEYRDEIESFIVSRKQSILLYEWLISSREASGLVIYGDDGEG